MKGKGCAGWSALQPDVTADLSLPGVKTAPHPVPRFSRIPASAHRQLMRNWSSLIYVERRDENRTERKLTQRINYRI